MQLESRIRRMREFLDFLLEKYAPRCYWCDKPIDPKSFHLSGTHTSDGLVIHHLDENRDHNEIENKILIHSECHQSLHKASTELGLQPEVVREAKMRQSRISK